MQKRFAIAALALIVLFSILPAEAQKEPIRVGFMSSLTGPLSPNGKDMLNSFELFLEEQGGKLAGREVKLVTEDDAGNPATGLTKRRGMAEGQGIQVLVGPLSAAVGYAIRDYIDGKKLPAIFPIVTGEDITQRKRSPYIVRTGWSSAQPSTRSSQGQTRCASLSSTKMPDSRPASRWSAAVHSLTSTCCERWGMKSSA